MLVGIVIIFYLYKSTLFSNIRKAILDDSKQSMAPHSSTLAWKIPWTEEPGRLWSMGS